MSITNPSPKEAMQGFRRMAGYIKQKDVADILGVTKLTFLRYENNPRRMPVGVLEKLEDLYGEDFIKYFFDHKLYREHKED